MSDIQTTAEAEENAALPALREVHADPARPATCEADLPPAMRGKAPKSPARWAYERLILYIRKFEERLDSEHEVAMGFVGGDAGVLRIEGMGYFDPDVVTFYGTDPAGGRTQLIQHVTQLSVMLRALPKPQSAEAPRRIGFRLSREIEPGEEDGTADEAGGGAGGGAAPQDGGAAGS
ncbi:DUF6173 family protein [Wenxinia saemankumensis]|uniref:Uncharacterized protein n=1 Tax=Wenxinia saemankumensis TaxID=1447782 RepID=A0A1M6E8T5_9RHOB|nr:DUF6173 family protein [Wenxinia saemankumensis]SHI81823.1 hypothetical protein SAMN05444417_1871 [Wenxinia saemankumensis]